MSAPPPEFQTWLDYALETMDVRGTKSDRNIHENEVLTCADIRAAAVKELSDLRRKAAMLWVGILENWQKPLSQRLGRSAKDIVEKNLLATDFSDESVRIQFEDGSDLRFQRAFYLGETPDDGAIHRVVVFTEHCGYHEFWIGPGSRISASSTFEASYKFSAEDTP